MALKKRTIPAPPKALPGAPVGPVAPKASKTRKVASAKPPSTPAAPAQPKVSVKNFSVQPWGCEGEGKRILIYAESGMGKTTLASLAPKPVFIGIDDGGKLLKDLRHVPDIFTFADVRGALQADIYADDKTVVIDQATALEEWAVKHVLDFIPNDKGVKMSNIIQYGWNGGFRHLYDTMHSVLQDCDGLIRQGKNIIMIAQAAPHNVANPGGEDFLRTGPRLCNRKGAYIEALYCEWADHLFFIDYQLLLVDDKKKASSDTKRAIFVHPEAHFRAKSRTLGLDKAVVAFDDPKDDSIWTFLFRK